MEAQSTGPAWRARRDGVERRARTIDAVLWLVTPAAVLAAVLVARSAPLAFGIAAVALLGALATRRRAAAVVLAVGMALAAVAAFAMTGALSPFN